MADPQQPILHKLKEIRRQSHGHGFGAGSRKQSIMLSAEEKRKLSMGYERYLGDFATDTEDFDLNELGLGLDRDLEDEDVTRPQTAALDQGFLSHNEFHQLMHRLVESRIFSGFILFIILLNTAVLIAQTWLQVSLNLGWYIAALDNAFLGIYIMEITLKLYVWRSKFFKEGWNVLDLTIVVFSTVDFMLPLIIQKMGGFSGTAIFRLLRIFRAVRAIRALRVLRTIRFLATLQVIMTTLLQSVRSIGAIVGLILLFMYMFAVVGRGLYAEADPLHFGNIGIAIFTLFQLLTLDDWYEIYILISKKDPSKSHVIFYLFLYIVVEYFIFLNLFVAVLVDNFQLTLEAQNEAVKRKKKSLDESDDENDYFHVEATPDSSIISEAEEAEKTVRKTVTDYYPSIRFDDRDRLGHYFRLLTALEYNKSTLQNQQGIVNMMVDLCDATNDDSKI